MARVIKCDICQAELAPLVSANKEAEKWNELDITPLVTSNNFKLHWDLCPLCSGWLTRTRQASKDSGGYPGERGGRG